jgi:hypothetical protein
VLHSSVDYKSGKAEVLVHPDWNLNFTDIKAKLDWDGFFIVEVERHEERDITVFESKSEVKQMPANEDL